MKIQALVCSENNYFMNAFSSYTMERNNTDFEFIFFTEHAAALKYIETHKIDLFLADEKILHDINLPANAICIAISNQTQIHMEGNCHEINIYQRGVDIVSDLQKIVHAIRGDVKSPEEKKQKIVAFFSPQGGSGKTTLAYACSLLKAQKEQCIYLNLEEFAYTEHLYQTNFQVSMEDIMLEIAENKDLTVSLSNVLAKNQHNVTVLPTFKYFNDFNDFHAGNIEILLNQLLRVSGSRYLFIDISGGLSDKNKRILEMSDMSFWIFDDSTVGKGKMNQIKNDISIQGMDFFNKAFFVLNRCKSKSEDSLVIRIPFSESLANGVDLERVLSGNIDFGKQCMNIVSLIDR